jgi:1-phosphofructokinase
VVKGGSVKVPVGSTVGAGDSVVAALAYAEDLGMGLDDTVRLAMATGAANVMQSGTQAAPRDLVDSLVDKVSVTRL